MKKVLQCTCKENGRRYGDVQWDTRGCVLHCEHPGINTDAPDWVCSCGATSKKPAYTYKPRRRWAAVARAKAARAKAARAKAARAKAARAKAARAEAEADEARAEEEALRDYDETIAGFLAGTGRV